MTVVINRNMPSRMAACIDNPRSMQVESVGADRWRSTRTRTIGSIRGVPLTIIPIIRVRHRVPGFAVARAGAGVHAAIPPAAIPPAAIPPAAIPPAAIPPGPIANRHADDQGWVSRAPEAFHHRSCSTTAVVPPPQLFHHHSCGTTAVAARPQLWHDRIGARGVSERSRGLGQPFRRRRR